MHNFTDESSTVPASHCNQRRGGTITIGSVTLTMTKRIIFLRQSYLTTNTEFVMPHPSAYSWHGLEIRASLRKRSPKDMVISCNVFCWYMLSCVFGLCIRGPRLEGFRRKSALPEEYVGNNLGEHCLEDRLGLWCLSYRGARRRATGSRPNSGDFSSFPFWIHFVSKNPTCSLPKIRAGRALAHLRRSCCRRWAKRPTCDAACRKKNENSHDFGRDHVAFGNSRPGGTITTGHFVVW